MKKPITYLSLIFIVGVFSCSSESNNKSAVVESTDAVWYGFPERLYTEITCDKCLGKEYEFKYSDTIQVSLFYTQDALDDYKGSWSTLYVLIDEQLVEAIDINYTNLLPSTNFKHTVILDKKYFRRNYPFHWLIFRPFRSPVYRRYGRFQELRISLKEWG